MPRYFCLDTLKFLLFDVHNIDEVLQLPHYSAYDDDMVNMVLDTTKAWADQDFYPYYRIMDEHPVHYADGKVRSHPILKKIFKDAGENGFISSYFEVEHGGSQMPFILSYANNFILHSANNHLPGYLGLTAGAAHLITTFGSQEIVESFVPRMLAGEWGGTMALTEPQAGSSLADISTIAYPQPDGTYRVKGQKIFISGGDHEATENIIHLTLAKIEGAPSGTKGISLFVIPRFKLHEGNYIDNDVFVAGDFQKLGQKGYSTVHLVFGENDMCEGYLVGEPHKGLQYMFQMMNGARIDVGISATATASAAYYHSLQYALERPQGRKILNFGGKDTHSSQTLIINHPDVKRMLWAQKSIVEASLSLLLFCAKMYDISLYDQNPEKKEEAKLLLEILVPIAKTYPSEMGRTAVNYGLQILGGYGYCTDFPLQQYLRDIRIMAIYEGTTGIQSLDLLGRKIPMQNGKALKLLKNYIEGIVSEALDDRNLTPYADSLSNALNEAEKTLQYLSAYALKGDFQTYLADATIFMDLLSNVVMGAQWLNICSIVQKSQSDHSPKYQKDFYQSKHKAMQYFFKYELPKVYSCAMTIQHKDKLTTDEDYSVII